MTNIARRLDELGIDLPVPAAPVANYIPFTVSRGIVHVSGQVSSSPDGGIKGRVGEDLDVAAGQRAARLCGINLIAQFRAACGGDLNRIARVLKLGGFVQAGAGFGDIPRVVNGCSDLMVELFGNHGRHARSAVGVYCLPLGFAVEVDAVIELRD